MTSDSRPASGPAADHPAAPAPAPAHTESDDGAPRSRARDRRDRRPATPAGVEVRWTRAGWRYRARRVVGGQARTGPLRANVDQAAADRQVLDERAGAFRRAADLTLGEALAEVVAAARDRGVQAATLAKTYQTHARFLERELGAATPLCDLADPAPLRAFLRRVVDAGRSPSTAWGKDAWLLGRALEQAGLPSPVPALRRELSRVGRFKRAPARLVVLTMTEVRDLLGRIRRGDVAPGRTVPDAAECEIAADLVELLAATGVRRGELARVALADVEVGRVWIAAPKDRGHPRNLEVPAATRPALDRLVARARQMQVSGENPGRLLVPGGEAELERTFRRWQQLLGEPRLCGRVLRRSFLTACAGATNDVLSVMRAAGHKHMSTTARYIVAAGQQQRELADAIGNQLHPRQ
jgi:integrase